MHKYFLIFITLSMHFCSNAAYANQPVDNASELNDDPCRFAWPNGRPALSDLIRHERSAADIEDTQNYAIAKLNKYEATNDLIGKSIKEYSCAQLNKKLKINIFLHDSSIRGILELEGISKRVEGNFEWEKNVCDFSFEHRCIDNEDWNRCHEETQKHYEDSSSEITRVSSDFYQDLSDTLENMTTIKSEIQKMCSSDTGT
jgi:hypothetical protein